MGSAFPYERCEIFDVGQESVANLTTTARERPLKEENRG